MAEKIIVQNRRAHHDYFILETIEAGIELRGTEVKSLRAGAMTLKDSYAEVRDGQLYLIGSHISPYEKGNIYNHDPERNRRLLIHKREINKLGAKVAEKGLTLVPLKVYFKEGRAKVELGLCKGKHTVDKRDTLREKDIAREADRAIRDVRRGK